MIPGHHRSAGDRPPAGRNEPAPPMLRPRHHLETPEFHGSCLGLAIPIAIVVYALAIVGALHLFDLVTP